jgi:hypothetical protein
MKTLLTLKPLVDIRVYIERSRWVLARWAICALLAAGGVAYVLAHLGPRVAIAG